MQTVRGEGGRPARYYERRRSQRVVEQDGRALFAFQSASTRLSTQ